MVQSYFLGTLRLPGFYGSFSSVWDLLISETEEHTNQRQERKKQPQKNTSLIKNRLLKVKSNIEDNSYERLSLN